MFKRLKSEFSGYNAKRFSKDLMAGLTVTAVALPLALAFGIGSGADAAAGLITAIIAGLVISALSGASFQISGPTGAMTAILINLISNYSLQAIFLVGLISGAILLLMGFFKLGKLVTLIPRPVITGFTSGIAIIIALGQVDNFFGTVSQGHSAIEKLVSYGSLGFSPNWQAVIVGSVVIVAMLIWPKKWNSRVPSSLVGLIIATVVSLLFKFDVRTIGVIPKTLLPQARLDLHLFTIKSLLSLLSPAITISVLAMIESLLCGASASRMKNENFDANQELIAQGIGNMIIPFFGGVPATAAIARTSVAIKSGCETRLTGIIHAIGLLASMFLFGNVMSKIPYAALAGVLMVTAWRMNEWPAIHNIFSKRFTGAILKYFITMVATVAFDLIVAIVIGIIFSGIWFLLKSMNLSIDSSRVKNELMHNSNKNIEPGLENAKVIYVSGPIFFGNAEKLLTYVHENYDQTNKLIFSMRGVTYIDTTGAEILYDIACECKSNNIEIAICGLQDHLRGILDGIGVTELIGDRSYYFSVDRLILANR